MSAPRASVTEVGGNTRVATREQHAEREGGGGKEERKVVTMAISAPIRNCRRLSGYPFSLTREMSIRFFGYFASGKRAARTNGQQAFARYLFPASSFYTLESYAKQTFQISLSAPSFLFPSPRPLSSTLDRPFTATVTDAPLDPRSRPPRSYFSHYFSDPVLLRRLPFFLGPVPRPCCRVSYSAFRCCSARSHASPQPREFIERNARRKNERETHPPIPRMFLHLGINRSAFSGLSIVNGYYGIAWLDRIIVSVADRLENRATIHREQHRSERFKEVYD